MAKSKSFSASLAVFAIIFAPVISYIVLSADPASGAQAQTTQLVRADSNARNGVVAQRVRVVDGDTIVDMGSDITYRLVNIDAPETGSRARCTAERTLGNRATQAARTLISGAQRIELNPTGRIDRYGRTIAFVVIDGRDMGDTLIAEGLARPWRGRREPWCDASGNLIP